MPEVRLLLQQQTRPVLPANRPRKPQQAELRTEEVLQKRRRFMGPNTALHYEPAPLHIVRGRGCYLYTPDDTPYLDCVNNVAHVGHCHPKVTRAVAEQLETLNTNVRFLHSLVPRHAEALAATLPYPLEVVYHVCSGSEANDLALRVARAAAPGHTHVAVMEGSYHGHVSSASDLSERSFGRPGGSGRPSWVHVLPLPDPYRGLHLDGRAAAEAAVAAAHAAGGRICAFFCESVLSCAGQVILPEGYLAAAYEVMQEEGALCIADEVQAGFGRVGSHFWAFETQGVAPDIVTAAKPMGNGFPMGAVVMSRALARAFNNGMAFFATCGGCTAAGAAGLAVLEVIAEEGLQANAAEMGALLLRRLREEVQPLSACIGDVRGLGLMLGLELVDGPGAKRPAGAAARWARDEALQRGVLLVTDGAHDHVIKIKPPLCFRRPEVDRLVAVLKEVFAQGVPAAVVAQDVEYWDSRQGALAGG